MKHWTASWGLFSECNEYDDIIELTEELKNTGETVQVLRSTGVKGKGTYMHLALIWSDMALNTGRSEPWVLLGVAYACPHSSPPINEYRTGR